MKRKDPHKVRLRSGLTALALIFLLPLFTSCSKARPKVILEPPPQIPAYSWVENPGGGACLDEAGLAALNVELDLLYERTRYLHAVALDLGATEK
jgi:hypothetical protein